METEPRPVTRADCAGGERPCPWVSCRHHLYLDVNEGTGSIRLNWPHLQPEQLLVSCTLDVADMGGASLETVGKILNVTREGLHLREVRALKNMKRRMPAAADVGLEEARVPRTRHSQVLRAHVLATLDLGPMTARELLESSGLNLDESNGEWRRGLHLVGRMVGEGLIDVDAATAGRGRSQRYMARQVT